ncbi:helix-turn-helix domain-containing protein [Nakamurella sp. YIM 132087]|uniref:Helix-turn-helix domain-containing protein n=2 Tax=Nakamurella alba TaxID=2665158 RepID=A0A7K1FK33_9ACTN|nr:helix-turn-helix domain-containing protein [Nakamurella alba]
MGPVGGAASTRAVDRAVQLLAQVCDHGEIGLADCARRAGLAPSTALRLLRSLETSGLIHRDDNGLFSAGPRLVQLGAQALSRQALVTSAGPALSRIVAGCGESAYLSLPGPTGTAVYAAMVEGVHSVRHTSWVGRTVPLDGTAVGRVFREDPAAHLFVVVASAVEPDVTAVAAAITRPGRNGRPVVAGALSVVGPTYRIGDDQGLSIGRLVAAEATALSARFGSVIGTGPVGTGSDGPHIDGAAAGTPRERAG